MGELPREWQVYQRRNRPKELSRQRKGSRSKRWRLSHHIWAWLIVLLLAAGVWIEGHWDRGAAVHSPT